MRASPCPAFTWAAVIAALSLGCSDFSDLQTDKDSRVAVLDRSVAGESSIIVDASGAPDRAAAVDSSAGPDTKRPPDLGEVPDGPWTIPAKDLPPPQPDKWAQKDLPPPKKDQSPQKDISPPPKDQGVIKDQLLPQDKGAQKDQHLMKDTLPPDGPAGPCKTPCDCIQGQTCINKACKKTSTPIYCCSKSPCPSGSSCVTTTGGPGMCGGSTKCTAHCDCAQGFACLSSVCFNMGSPIYCCDKGGCPFGQTCVNKSGIWKTCPGSTSCSSACDCTQGQACTNGVCATVSPKVYCCSKSGCPASYPCFKTNGSSGVCPGGGTSCKTHCDCNQKYQCALGNCILGYTPFYCCSKSGCPTGKGCYKKSGTKDYCP